MDYPVSDSNTLSCRSADLLMHFTVLDGFMWMFMDQNSDTHTGAASMLPTKSSPQPSKVKFISLKFTRGKNQTLSFVTSSWFLNTFHPLGRTRKQKNLSDTLGLVDYLQLNLWFTMRRSTSLGCTLSTACRCTHVLPVHIKYISFPVFLFFSDLLHASPFLLVNFAAGYVNTLGIWAPRVLWRKHAGIAVADDRTVVMFQLFCSAQVEIKNSPSFLQGFPRMGKAREIWQMRYGISSSSIRWRT